MPARGAGATTLVLYADRYTPYSLVDSLETLALQLRRLDLSLQMLPLTAAPSNQVENADYIVVFCPQKNPTVPAPIRMALSQTNRPVLWIGWGGDQMGTNGPLSGPFRIRKDAPELLSTAVHYRNRTWVIPPALWLPVQRTTASDEAPLMTLARANTAPEPACWKAGHVTFFGSVPGNGPLSYLFGDLLLDFFGVTEVAPPCVMLRIEDYHPLSNHHHFMRMVDFLYARGIPFLVAVTPASRDPQTGQIQDLESRADFVLALRYAQQRGGRVVLRGCLRSPGETGEFWNLQLDRPPENDIAPAVQACLETACRQLVRHGLLPLAWETPHYAAASAALGEIAKCFSTAVERVQLSDTTRHAIYTPVGLTQDRFGRLILPENLGSVPTESATATERMIRQARPLLDLRGPVLGCDIHAYLPLDRLMRLVDHLESLQVPFLDLADLDHWVRWPGGLLLTGRAQVRTLLGYGAVHWRAFDRSGRLVGETTARTLFSGEHVFERRGLGAVELFESVELQP